MFHSRISLPAGSHQTLRDAHPRARARTARARRSPRSARRRRARRAAAPARRPRRRGRRAAARARPSSPPMPAPTIRMRNVSSPASSPASGIIDRAPPMTSAALWLWIPRSRCVPPRNDRRCRNAHTPARARRLFGDRRPAAAEAARRRAHRVLDHREPRSVGHRQADGAAGAAGADRAADAARRAELELARIRHARRRVALLRPVSRGSASARRSRSTRASARTTRASPRRRRTPAGNSWAIPTSRARSTRSRTRPR